MTGDRMKPVTCGSVWWPKGLLIELGVSATLAESLGLRCPFGPSPLPLRSGTTMGGTRDRRRFVASGESSGTAGSPETEAKAMSGSCVDTGGNSISGSCLSLSLGTAKGWGQTCSGCGGSCSRNCFSCWLD